MAVEARRLETVDGVFGIEAASRLLAEALPPWMQELGLLVEAIGHSSVASITSSAARIGAAAASRPRSSRPSHRAASAPNPSRNAANSSNGSNDLLASSYAIAASGDEPYRSAGPSTIEQFVYSR